MDTKKCTLCKKILPLENFAKKGNGKQSRCRKCHGLYTKDHYRKNKQYYVEKAARNSAPARAEARAYLFKIKSETPCTDCGKFFHPCAMDFDHIRDKKHDVGWIVNQGLKALLAEIDKCELVCAICHRIRTYNRQFNTNISPYSSMDRAQACEA